MEINLFNAFFSRACMESNGDPFEYTIPWVGNYALLCDCSQLYASRIWAGYRVVNIYIQFISSGYQILINISDVDFERAFVAKEIKSNWSCSFLKSVMRHRSNRDLSGCICTGGCVLANSILPKQVESVCSLITEELHGEVHHVRIAWVDRESS